MHIKQLANFLTSAIVPRPIAFVSSMSAAGVFNLSPFSFFNLFSNRPPIFIFSPAKSVLTGKQKDTLINVTETKECVIHIPTINMVEQLSVSSGAYAPEVDEFKKSGFTPIASDIVKVPRIMEAPVAFECKVNDIICLGEEGGAGNLVICQVLMMHVDEKLLDENEIIDTDKLKPISRLAYNNYSFVTKDNIFSLPKPVSSFGVGVDAIPDWVLQTGELTGNELGKLASVHETPLFADGLPHDRQELLQEVKALLKENKVAEAWKLIAFR